MVGILVFGTDPGVGKRTVGSTLVKATRSFGLKAVPINPVETGIGGGMGRIQCD